MNAYAQRTQEQRSRAVANAFSRTRNDSSTVSQSLDATLNQSPSVQSQLQLKQNLNQSPRVLIQAHRAEALSNRKAALQPSFINRTADRISGQKVIQRTNGHGSEQPSTLEMVGDWLRTGVGFGLSMAGGQKLFRATVGSARGLPLIPRFLTAVGGGIALGLGEKLMDPGEPRSFGMTESGKPYTTGSKEGRRRPTDILDIAGTGAYGISGGLALALPQIGLQSPLARRMAMRILAGKAIIASYVLANLLSGRRPMYPPESEGGGTRFGMLGPGDPGTKMTEHPSGAGILPQGRNILEWIAGLTSVGYGGYAIGQAAKPASWLKTLPRLRMLGAGLAAAGAGASILRPQLGSFGLTEQGEFWKSRETEPREAPTPLEAMGYPLYGIGGYYMHQAAFNRMRFLDRRYMAFLALMAMHMGRNMITSSQQGASGITPEGRLFFRSGTLPRIKEEEETSRE